MNFINKIFKGKKSGAFFNATDYEMNNFLCGIGKSEIREHKISISEYPFQPSIVYPDKLVSANEINFISTEFGICRIYIDDDIVFITSEQKSELLSFAKRNNIKIKKHSWNWDWILEPYLDTELTAEEEIRIEKNLNGVRIDKIEIQKIRDEVGKQMYKYNFDTMLWEWCSLGLYDVLAAMRVKYDKVQFESFYKKAIEIDKRE